MTGKIFISYRRDDSMSESREITTSLINHNPASSVFFDARSVKPGDRWPDEIRGALENAQLVVVVIKDADKWLGVGKYGARRIDEPDDWVRQEAAVAIAQNKTVIPVLVGEQEQIVPAKHLPDEIRLLPSMQCVHLRRVSWKNDMRILIEAVYPVSTDHLQTPADENPGITSPQLSARCQAVLRDYNRKCLADWAQNRPSRFIEPCLAIRNDTVLDRSETPSGGETRQDHKSLLTGDEKKRLGDTIAVEQYRRLFEQRPKKTTPCARLCITEDAGAGKSIFTHHLRSVLASESGQAAIFGGAPGLVVRWEGREQTWPFDLRQALEKELVADCLAHGVTAGQVLEHALKQHAACLIFDALDQVTDGFTLAGQRIERPELLDRIFGFLKSDDGQQCHVVITGRSYAVTREADGMHFPSDAWTFATLEGFDQGQQKRYLSDFLGNRRLEDLIPSYREVSELLAVPVILNLIAEIAEADPGPREKVCLHQFRTRGDVYREAHEKLAERAEKNRIKANDTARARWESILSAAAFAMMCDEKQRRNYAVPGTQAVTKFRAATARWARKIDGKSLDMSDGDWDELTAFSQLTHHLSVETCHRSMVSWKHRGWMEYFAGLYLARYAPPEAALHVARFSNDPDWHWAWRFAIEMPPDVADANIRTPTLAPLFRRPETGRRPNELIHRAWRVMEAAEAGREILNVFLSEYNDLVAAGNPLAEEIEASFLPCPPKPDCDSLTFMMASPDTDTDAYRNEKPQVQMTVNPFQMANAPVTKEQYWLYDPGHEHDPPNANDVRKYSPEPNCPVI